MQFVFARQWNGLRTKCAEHRVHLIGDLPIFVAQDSADVWARPDLFLLDERGRPLFVAGVPRLFQRDRAALGNPLYRWDAHASERFAWWIARLKSVLEPRRPRPARPLARL